MTPDEEGGCRKRTSCHGSKSREAWPGSGQTATSASFEIKELPECFVRWQLDYKHGIYDAIEKDEYVRFNAGHLPVVGTWGEGSTFPNLANKGIGFTPKDEHIDHYLSVIERAVAEIEKLPPHAVDDTRGMRVAAAREFYAHPEHIDWRRLALLEIFEGGTFRTSPTIRGRPCSGPATRRCS